MTEFDPTTPAMRMFENIDYAPAPNSEILKKALAFWAEQRDQMVMPSVEALCSNPPEEIMASVFMISPSSNDDGFELVSAGTEVLLMFSSEHAAKPLIKLPNRRLAVHVRHLCELVVKRHEPACAKFTINEPDEDPVHYEIVVAPASKGENMDWVFGAAARR